MTNKILKNGELLSLKLDGNKEKQIFDVCFSRNMQRINEWTKITVITSVKTFTSALNISCQVFISFFLAVVTACLTPKIDFEFDAFEKVDKQTKINLTF